MHNSIPEPDGAAALPTLRELEVLRAMISTRKTVAAAAQIGISQPAVSRAIAALESRTGTRLFLRSGGRLTPTAEAFALGAEADNIFATLERIADRPARRAGRSAIRAATTPTLAHNVLPPLLAEMRRDEPETVMEVEIATGTDVIAAVADRRVDVGLVDTPAPHPAVRAEAFREAIAHVIMPADDPLARHERLTVAEIGERDLIAHARRFTSRAQFERVFAAAGLTPRIVAVTTTATLSVELVRAGVGLALANPYPLSLSNFDGLVARPFEPAIPYRVCLLFPAEGRIDPAARRFADRLKANQPVDGLTTPVR